MRKLTVFNFMTMNGYFKGANEDISWHKNVVGEEEAEFANEGAQSQGTLLFGRVTYEMMVSFWPTPAAKEAMPLVADGMNKSEKIVFSRTMKTAEWNNTRVISGNIVEEVKKLKKASGSDITILGSGSIVTQLAEAGLIDEYQFMVDPVALGEGTPPFKGMKRLLSLKLTHTKNFKTGVVLNTYVPVENEL